MPESFVSLLNRDVDEDPAEIQRLAAEQLPRMLRERGFGGMPDQRELSRGDGDPVLFVGSYSRIDLGLLDDLDRGMGFRKDRLHVCNIVLLDEQDELVLPEAVVCTPNLMLRTNGETTHLIGRDAIAERLREEQPRDSLMETLLTILRRSRRPKSKAARTATHDVSGRKMFDRRRSQASPPKVRR